MLQDIIYRAPNVDIATNTHLLPYDFFRRYIPLSMEVEDSFDLRSHTPIDNGDFTPRRIYYLSDIDCYLLLDLADVHMPAFYLIDGQTHEIKCSYTYMVESYSGYKEYDQIVDACVHHVDMVGKGLFNVYMPVDNLANDVGNLTVTFLIINNHVRTATLATFRLEYARLGELHNDTEGSQVFHLNLIDLQHFVDIIPAGKWDEIAIGYEEARGGPENKQYPCFLVDSLVPTLKENLFIGELVPKYCNVTSDDKGRFFILLGTRITVWMGPFLPFPVDAQYLVIMDHGGLNIKFILIAPQQNAISFDERQDHQPYKYSLSTWDGRYLLCMEDRKSRYLSPKLVFDPEIQADGSTRKSSFYCDRSYPGGMVADFYYPMRMVSGETTVGYCTQWDDSSYLEPIHRETIWATVNICDLLQDIQPALPEESPPYSADIVLLIDDSATMAPAMNAVYSNITNLINNLNVLHVTDIHLGVALFQNNQKSIYDPTGTTPSKWATAFPGYIEICRYPSAVSTGQTNLLRAANDNPQRIVDPFTSIDWVTSNYKYRDEVRAKFIVVISDAGDEVRHDLTKTTVYKAWDPVVWDQTVAKPKVTQAAATAAMKALGITLFVVTPSQYQNDFKEALDGTNGGFLAMTSDSSSWGTALAIDLAQFVLSKTGIKTDAPKDWWSYIQAKWGPVIHYHYSPELDFEGNGLISVFHDDVTYINNGTVIRNKINWLTCFDNYPALGGEAQDSFYLPGLIPGEEMTQVFVIRNESYTGTMKQIALELLDKPDDVEVTVENWPETLEPRQTAAITIKALYESQGSENTVPVRHIDIHYKMTYWMTHVLACGQIEEKEDSDPLVDLNELFFVENNQATNFVGGIVKSIVFDPMYTLAFNTTTDYKEDDLAEQESWVDRLYILEKTVVNSPEFERIRPVPISSIAGYTRADTGCCWLKVRGPVVWTTSRTYECRVNIKTWYLVNQSLTNTYVAHPVMDPTTAPDQKGMGFILFEYPEGNIIPPGESRPVVIKWQPIFDPEGEEMTRKITRPPVRDIQDGAVSTIWSTEDGFFNHILYAMATGHVDPTSTVNNIVYSTYPDYDTVFTHTYVETVHGDGMDIPILPDQPLHKLDAKQLAMSPYCYDTKVYYKVDTDLVEEGFQFLTRAGIWMGVKDDPEANDLSLPLGAKPSDMFDYVEWISPASGLEELPHYIDHKFKVNTLYTYNADTPCPYQLAPFNMEYANPYAATLFMGNDIIKTIDVPRSMFEDFNVYADLNAKIVPCSPTGQEQVGWLLEDFWPVSGDRNVSIARLATENDYIFTKTLYVLNKDTAPHQIVLDYDANVINGVSVQGVDVTSNAMCPPGGIATLEVSFRLHYTYQESHCVNLVKEILYVPVFLED